MVQELKEVLSKVEQLKDDEQREIAKLLQQEVSWDDSLNESQDLLSQLADEAIQDHKAGRTTKTDW
jgi:aspartate/glutamate racemase